ncbi:uncharacterized protein N7483_002150 [Penicillium malachiteum]|uniref:uncharacterized protein n=1 Tax=Penicillium malachiteum TaxID=1324776 RepID=UPI00254819CB|nr:uncharacterized protein N7483_002150 [Penicillium malachiteum]KAJ5737025.1 hypothetical protein N7483_002150 [Penicillium malachiteum]
MSRNNNKELEDKIDLALRAMRKDSKPNISKYARDFAVPYAKLRARFNGRKSLFELSSTQNTALCKWIDSNYREGSPLTRQEALKAATAMLRLSNPSSPPLDSRWFGHWLRRHPNYATRCLSDGRRLTLSTSERLSPSPSPSLSESSEVLGVINLLTRLECEMARVRGEDILSAQNSASEDEYGDDDLVITRYPPGLFSSSLINTFEQRWENLNALDVSDSEDSSDSETLEDDETLLSRYPPGLFSLSLIKTFEQRWQDIKH